MIPRDRIHSLAALSAAERPRRDFEEAVRRVERTIAEADTEAVRDRFLAWVRTVPYDVATAARHVELLGRIPDDE